MLAEYRCKEKQVEIGICYQNEYVENNLNKLHIYLNIMPYSYEEIRDTILEILSGREEPLSQKNQYIELQYTLAKVFKKRESSSVLCSSGNVTLKQEDREIFLEVFWDLFRQGIITLGLNDSSPNFPWFRVSAFGKILIDSHEPYFFHDVSSYEQVIREQIPEIDKTTAL